MIPNMCDKVIRYENGEMSEQETLEFFAELVKSGDAWTLQGCYGRMAHNLIESGFLDRNGNILRHFSEDEA